MKMCVIIEEFLYAKKIENQTQRMLRGYKNTLNLFASWLEQKWSIDELEDIRVSHLKQYVSYHLKVGHKGIYVNGIIKILRAFFTYTNGEDYTTIEYKKVAWVKEGKPVIKAFTAQEARRMTGSKADAGILRQQELSCLPKSNHYYDVFGNGDSLQRTNRYAAGRPDGYLYSGSWKEPQRTTCTGHTISGKAANQISDTERSLY